jgi:rRNA-processing protein FCF1
VLVVLDTNAFHSDVHATRPRLRGILDAPLKQAAFEVFVPEVVLRELDWCVAGALHVRMTG